MRRRRVRRGGPERGAAVVDFVLVLVVLVPLFLGILQVALVLFVRNTLTAAASEGARYAATVDRPLSAGVEETRRQISGALAARFASQISAEPETVRGAPGVRVEVVAEVPPLGLWGPAVRLEVNGHAVEEVAP
ncbi:MAG TPA: TadE/TadG family type IV pilus assembly protein [Nocardioidaceae bacterium]|nr:TadE/TadG family type IV pilus assembly protein [Nocardioidaceae bacterium]